ncbi:MAG: PcfJ domain-containing protein [Candidatus Marinimicrobia bacterium]|nr:PcfJ domain-containing protein [Candidatus Neomarinimicrobiota bacterium]
MKQKSDGKKVINWHRPLRSGEHTQRYRRNRWAEVSDDHLISPEEYERDNYYGDYYWDIDEPASPTDYAIYKTWAHLTAIHQDNQFTTAFEKIGWPISGDGDPIKDIIPDKMQEGGMPGAAQKIEGHLAKHIKGLIDGWFDPNDLPLSKDKDDLQIIFDLANNEEVEQQIPENLNLGGFEEERYQQYNNNLYDSPFLLCLLLSPFWVRSPKTWVKPIGSDVFLHFVRHLFEIYPTPKFLMSEWTVPFSAVRYKWLIFYIILAQGGSIKKAAPLFNWSIGKQFTKHLLDAPEGLSPVQAAIYSKIMCLGGSLVEFNRISRNAAYIEDPTETSIDTEYKVFWESTVLWLMKHRDDLTEDDADLILEWAMHRFTEDRHNDQSFTWSGRTSGRTLFASQQYIENRDSPWIDYYWSSHGWNWDYVDEYYKNWSFLELTSGKQLFEESQKLHHCVESYAARCASKNSAIVSVSCNKEKILTVEINPQGNEIVQVKGVQNRFPSATENKIIDMWHAKMVSKKP